MSRLSVTSRLIARVREEKGFTLAELVVVLSVLAVLTAVLTPMVINVIEDGRRARAKADVKTIGGAIIAFNKDLNNWPIWASGGATGPGDTAFKALKSSEGDDPLVGDGSGWTVTGGDVGNIDGQFMTNALGYPASGQRRWQGPYLERVGSDPWGSRYLVNVAKLKPAADFGSEAIYVLSAGVNKIIETKFSQKVGEAFIVGGDDFVYRIK